MDESLKTSPDNQSAVSPIRYANTDRTGYMECLKCESVVNITIQKRDEDQPCGRALLLELKGEGPLILLDICIYNEADRRRGMADDIMSFMREIFPYIATSHISKAGLKLCKKHGFTKQRKIFKKDPDILIWDGRGGGKDK